MTSYLGETTVLVSETLWNYSYSLVVCSQQPSMDPRVASTTAAAFLCLYDVTSGDLSAPVPGRNASLFVSSALLSVSQCTDEPKWFSSALGFCPSFPCLSTRGWGWSGPVTHKEECTHKWKAELLLPPAVLLGFGQGLFAGAPGFIGSMVKYTEVIKKKTNGKGRWILPEYLEWHLNHKLDKHDLQLQP